MHRAEIPILIQVAPPTIPRVEVPILPQIKRPTKTRQTRSSRREKKIAIESLSPIEKLNQSQLREQQHYEINRIIDSSPDEALRQFHHADKAAITQVYKQLSALTHPDKQPTE